MDLGVNVIVEVPECPERSDQLEERIALLFRLSVALFLALPDFGDQFHLPILRRRLRSARQEGMKKAGLYNGSWARARSDGVSGRVPGTISQGRRPEQGTGIAARGLLD